MRDSGSLEDIIFRHGGRDVRRLEITWKFLKELEQFFLDHPRLHEKEKRLLADIVNEDTVERLSKFCVISNISETVCLFILDLILRLGSHAAKPEVISRLSFLAENYDRNDQPASIRVAAMRTMHQLNPGHITDKVREAFVRAIFHSFSRSTKEQDILFVLETMREMKNENRKKLIHSVLHKHFATLLSPRQKSSVHIAVVQTVGTLLENFLDNESIFEFLLHVLMNPDPDGPYYCLPILIYEEFCDCFDDDLEDVKDISQWVLNMLLRQNAKKVEDKVAAALVAAQTAECQLYLFRLIEKMGSQAATPAMYSAIFSAMKNMFSRSLALDLNASLSILKLIRNMGSSVAVLFPAQAKWTQEKVLSLLQLDLSASGSASRLILLLGICRWIFSDETKFDATRSLIFSELRRHLECKDLDVQLSTIQCIFQASERGIIEEILPKSEDQRFFKENVLVRVFEVIESRKDKCKITDALNIISCWPALNASLAMHLALARLIGAQIITNLDPYSVEVCCELLESQKLDAELHVLILQGLERCCIQDKTIRLRPKAATLLYSMLKDAPDSGQKNGDAETQSILLAMLWCHSQWDETAKIDKADIFFDKMQRLIFSTLDCESFARILLRIAHSGMPINTAMLVKLSAFLEDSNQATRQSALQTFTQLCRIRPPSVVCNPCVLKTMIQVAQRSEGPVLEVLVEGLLSFLNSRVGDAEILEMMQHLIMYSSDCETFTRFLLRAAHSGLDINAAMMSKLSAFLEDSNEARRQNALQTFTQLCSIKPTSIVCNPCVLKPVIQAAQRSEGPVLEALVEGLLSFLNSRVGDVEILEMMQHLIISPLDCATFTRLLLRVAHSSLDINAAMLVKLSAFLEDSNEESRQTALQTVTQLCRIKPKSILCHLGILMPVIQAAQRSDIVVFKVLADGLLCVLESQVRHIEKNVDLPTNRISELKQDILQALLDKRLLDISYFQRVIPLFRPLAITLPPDRLKEILQHLNPFDDLAPDDNMVLSFFWAVDKMGSQTIPAIMFMDDFMPALLRKLKIVGPYVCPITQKVSKRCYPTPCRRSVDSWRDTDHFGGDDYYNYDEEERDIETRIIDEKEYSEILAVLQKYYAAVLQSQDSSLINNFVEMIQVEIGNAHKDCAESLRLLLNNTENNLEERHFADDEGLETDSTTASLSQVVAESGRSSPLSELFSLGVDSIDPSASAHRVPKRHSDQHESAVEPAAKRQAM